MRDDERTRRRHSTTTVFRATAELEEALATAVALGTAVNTLDALDALDSDCSGAGRS